MILLIHVSTPGLEMHVKLAEDLGVKLGVHVAGAKLPFREDHREIIHAIVVDGL